MSTFTPNKTLEEPANNADINTWDVPMNANFTAIDVAFGGASTINAVGASGVTALTLAQYKPPTISITGALTANVNYQLPANVGGQWSIYNNTSGAFTITISSATGGGTTVVLAQGFRTSILCDGTNVALASTTPAAAGGSNTQVQFNSAGALSGSANLVWGGTYLGITGALRLYGASAGYMGLQCPATGGSVTFTLPAADGTNGQFLSTNGAGILSWQGTTAGVSSFSAGSTGLTPTTPAGGAVSLGGTLNTGHGGTGSTSAATGTGGVVLSTSPTLTTPTLTTPTITGLAATTSAAGILTTATSAMVATGTDTASAVTSAAIGGLYSLSSAISITTGSSSGSAGTPSFTPVRWQAYLNCIGAIHSYQVGDIIPLGGYGSPGGSGASFGVGIYLRSGSLSYIIGSNGIQILDASTGSQFQANPANFDMFVQAWGY